MLQRATTLVTPTGQASANPSHDAWPGRTTELNRAVSPIRRAALRRGLTPFEVDDVIQDTLCQAWLKRDEYDGSRPMILWLYGFGVRAIRARRRARSMGREDGEFIDVTTGEPPPDTHAEAGESCHRIRAIVAQSPLRYREILLARYWAGMSISDVATEHGISIRAAEGRLARALRWLQERLSRTNQPVLRQRAGTPRQSGV